MSGALVSRLPGRLRLRDKELRRHLRAGTLQAEMGGWDGVVSVEANPVTGSILLHYDVARLRPTEIEDRVERRLRTLLGDVRPPERTEAEAADPAFWPVNRYAKFGMLGSLTATLLGLAVNKRFHAASGGLYLAFLLVHLANYRKQLLR